MSENYQGLITITDLTDNKSCEISGINVFKYNENGEISSSSSVTLTATLSENISGGNWQYKNSSGNFVNFSPAQSGNTITINHTDNIFINDIATIKKLTNDESVFDIFTITKIRDGSPGDALINASLSNDNQTIPCDENGVPFQSAFPVSSKITIYEGTEDITNEYSISATIQSDSGTPRLIGSISGSTFTATSWNTLSQAYYTATVTFTCTRTGYAPISKVLTLSKITTGSSPNYYELTYDILATNKNISNIFNPSSVTFRANHINGETIEDYQGYLKLYRIKLDGTQQTITTSDMSSDSSGGYKYTYTFSQTLDADTKYLSAELYKTGGVGDCLDKQSIVVTSDGQTGASPINIVLGNVADVIPCDTNGKIKTNLTINIPFTAYKGTSQVPATITKSNITTRPSNLTDSDITITSSTASSSGSIQFILYANSELGSNSGEITLTFTCDGKQVPMKYSWSKSIQALPGADGPQGFSIVTSVKISSSTEDNWVTWGTTGHIEEWAGTSEIRNNCRVGDLFTVVGTSNEGNAHTLTYKSTTASGNLKGECLSSIVSEAGESGSYLVSTSIWYGKSESNTSYADITWYSWSGGNIPVTTDTTKPYLWTKTEYIYSDTSLNKTTYNVSTSSDSVEIGGRNLLLNSSGNSGKSYDPKAYLCASYYIDEEYPLVLNETYTITINYTNAAINEGDQRTSIACYVGGGSYIINSWVSIPSEGTFTSSWKFTATQNMVSADNYINVYASTTTGTQGSAPLTGELSVNWISLERGNKITDWKPNPKDILIDISNISSNLNNTQNYINNSSICYAYGTSQQGDSFSFSTIDMNGNPYPYRGIMSNYKNNTTGEYLLDLNIPRNYIWEINPDWASKYADKFMLEIDDGIKIYSKSPDIYALLTAIALEFVCNDNAVASFGYSDLFEDYGAITSHVMIQGNGSNIKFDNTSNSRGRGKYMWEVRDNGHLSLKLY